MSGAETYVTTAVPSHEKAIMLSKIDPIPKAKNPSGRGLAIGLKMTRVTSSI
jgi:hypothetical protein